MKQGKRGRGGAKPEVVKVTLSKAAGRKSDDAVNKKVEERGTCVKSQTAKNFAGKCGKTKSKGTNKHTATVSTSLTPSILERADNAYLTSHNVVVQDVIKRNRRGQPIYTVDTYYPITEERIEALHKSKHKGRSRLRGVESTVVFPDRR